MPYPRAHWVLLLLVPLTLIAFSDSYFSVLGTSSAAHHAHGITASFGNVQAPGAGPAIQLIPVLDFSKG